MGGGLPEGALLLYGAYAAQDWNTARRLDAQYPGARDALVEWGLVTDEEQPVARDPQHALRTKVSAELAKARHHIEMVETMPELSRDLIREYQQVKLRVPGSSSEYLVDPETVNARLQDVVAGARWEILAAQPGGPRSRELLEIAVARDSAALDRGVDLRTIYRDTVRDHPVTAQYARTMSARTEGRPARYATLVGDFERMIIVDRQTAFVSDHIVENSPPHSAWMVTDPAVVAVLARVHDMNWRRAQPWMGEMRTTCGPSPVGADGVRTNRQQRGILRYLAAGVSQAATARKLGVSKRKLEEDIAVLKALWGVRTVVELVFQYALSPDRLVDDSDALTAGQGLEGPANPVTTQTAGTAA